MRIILRQTFTLGRFHATPWKAFPFDDPHGEWPPSPWRLLRGILARSHQWGREGAAMSDDHRRALVRAVATSRVSWHLPLFTSRGPGLRQYQPAEWSWVPKSPKKPGKRGYNPTLVQDNFWLTNRHEGTSDEVQPRSGGYLMGTLV
jgi:hypothetical protein